MTADHFAAVSDFPVITDVPRTEETSAMRPRDYGVEVIAEVPLMFFYTHPDAPPEVQRRKRTEWMAGIFRYESFWAERDQHRDGRCTSRIRAIAASGRRTT